MPYINNCGVNIYYETHGSGEPLLLVQGLGGCIRGWDCQVKFFAKNYKVILIDNRGAGLSDKPDEEYSLDIFASDVKTVLDTIGERQVNILGVSMGGFIAQRFYSLFPEMVKTMILGCTGTGLNDPHHHMFSPELKSIIHSERNDDNYPFLTKEMHKHFFHPKFRAKNTRFMEAVFRFAKLEPQPHHSYKRQLMACYSTPELSKFLDKITVPTLVIHGADDVVVPVANAHYLANNIPNAKLKIIPETGHMFFIEKCANFNDDVLEFLRGNHNICNHCAQINKRPNGLSMQA